MNRHLFFTYAIIMLSICISFLSNAQKIIEIPINTKKYFFAKTFPNRGKCQSNLFGQKN